MKKINIGILGCASIASRSMIPAIKQMPEKFQLVAVASRDLKKAEELAKRVNCKALEGYQALIDSTEVDAVYIPLPTGLHYEWIKKAIDSGKHIYAEKSFASNYLQTKELVGYAKQKNIVLMEGFMFQYHSQHQFVKQIVEKGEIGEIRHFQSSFCFPPLKTGDFRYDAKIGGGAILDAAGYTVRAVNFILGNSYKVTSATVKYRNFASIYGAAFMEGKAGVGATLHFGFDTFYQCEYILLGTEGKITLTKAFTPRKDEKPICLIEKQDVKTSIYLPVCDHFYKALEEFASLIDNKKNRTDHYNDILLQSENLSTIFEMTKIQINE